MTNTNKFSIDNIAGVREINDEAASVCSGGSITFYDDPTGNSFPVTFGDTLPFTPGRGFDLYVAEQINPIQINRKASRIEITQGVYLVRSDDPNNAFLLSPGTHVLTDPGFSGFDNAITSFVRVL